MFILKFNEKSWQDIAGTGSDTEKHEGTPAMRLKIEQEPQDFFGLALTNSAMLITTDSLKKVCTCNETKV